MGRGGRFFGVLRLVLVLRFYCFLEECLLIIRDMDRFVNSFSEKMQNKFRKKSAFPEKGVKSADTQPLCAVGYGCSLSGFVIE